MSTVRKLQLDVISSEGSLPVNPWGGKCEVLNDYFEGSVFMTHLPPKGHTAPFAYASRLANKGNPDWVWELMIQGRFRKNLRSPPCFRGELRDGPMKLGLVSRALCGVILKFAKMQAQKRGFDLRYAFGDIAGERPHIELPLFALDRIFVSDRPLALPLGGDETSGTWRIVDGQYIPIDRSSVILDTSSYFTFAMASGYLDWSSWAIMSLPGVGALPLETFWGEQGLWACLVEKDSEVGKDGYLFEMHLSAPKQATRALSREPADALVTQEVLHAEDDVEADAQEQEQDQEPEDLVECHSHHTPYDDLSPRKGPLVDEGHMRGMSADAPSNITSSRIERLIESANMSHLQMVLSSKDLPHEERNAPSLPWYFQNAAGELWWCISYLGRLCWRSHDQLEALCKALGPEEGPYRKHSVQELERTRRIATRLFLKGHRGASGLLDEFTHVEVDLPSLLSNADHDDPPGQHRAWVGVVEAEGRIVERYLRLSDMLQWRCQNVGGIQWVSSVPAVQLPEWADSKIVPTISVELAGAIATTATWVGAPAVELQAQHKRFVFVFTDEVVSRTWASALSGRPASTFDVFWPSMDVLRRWPKSRVVLNDSELCLETCEDPLALSADLVRQAVGAQGAGAGDDAVRRLTSNSCALKSLDLSALGQQDLWCFWVNVYHCLLVHAQIVHERPQSGRQMVGFYNNCSYLVAGHIFSLVEIEHCILRNRMTKPRVRLRKLLLRMWRRNDADLEERPCFNAPQNPASAFKCRADWRLNLVLAAGTISSSEAIPVFRACTHDDFNKFVHIVMVRTLMSVDRYSRTPKTLPNFPAELFDALKSSLPDVARVRATDAARVARARASDTASAARAGATSAARVATQLLPERATGAANNARATAILVARRAKSAKSQLLSCAVRQDQAVSPPDSPNSTHRETLNGEFSAPSTPPGLTELPFVLYRFRDDAPPGVPGEGHERRWAHALAPLGVLDNGSLTYKRTYNWTFRERLDLLELDYVGGSDTKSDSASEVFML